MKSDWPYDPEARWHLFAFEVERSRLDELRGRLRGALLWDPTRTSLVEAVQAILPRPLVDLGLGGAYDALSPAGRMLEADIDPFEPADLLLAERLVAADFPLHVDAAPWTDAMGAVSWASGDDI